MVKGILSATTISGIISNRTNGQPIELANVVVKETEQGTFSNNRGYFVITNVELGTYTLFVSHISFAVTEQTVVVREEGNVYVNIELPPRAIQMDEIVISATNTRDEVNSREIVISRVGQSTRQLIDVVAVVEPDVFRSLLTLPGVTPIADFSSGMYIRGGSPDQNQILLDDIEVYNPTRFGGLFSTFNVDAIENVELYKGGFPAKYGGRLSSVLDVRNRDGNRKFHQGKASLSLISFQATLDGPWHLGSQSGSYMGSFRRSHLELMRQAIDVIPDYYFYDGHIKVNYDIGQKDMLSASTYFGYDKLDMDIGSRMVLEWGNNTSSAHWMHISTPQLFSQFIVANSSFESIMELYSGQNSFKRKNRIEDITAKGIMSYTLNNAHLLEFGLETKYNTVDFINTTGFDMPIEKLPNVQAEVITNDIYIQDSWTMNSFWTFQPGVRASSYLTTKINMPSSPDANYFRVSPRASLRRKLTIDSNVYVNYGRYYQFLAQINPGISTPLDVWVPRDGSIEPGQADHYILGYKHEFMEGLALDIELYYKDMKNLVDYNWDVEAEYDHYTFALDDVLNVGTGNAKGVDFLLRTDRWGWIGFLGYSFGVTKYKFKNTNLNPQTGQTEYFYPKHDRNHQINMVQSYNITQQTGKQLWGADMLAGITYAYATGQPTAVPEMVYHAGDHIEFLYSYADAERLPYYSRLDLSFKLQWYNRKNMIEAYLQVINATNRENVFSRNYYVGFDEAGTMELKHTDFNQFPLIPFIGVNVSW